jgi:antitoxin (DNA-binding transcriptional repressor) of toxin-antitoxin stability system
MDFNDGPGFRTGTKVSDDLTRRTARGTLKASHEGISMSAIDIKDVQTKIAEMLEAVERGETVAIMRDGNPVAKLEPVFPNVVIHGGKPLPDLTEFRASLKVNKLGNSVMELRAHERY